MSLLPFAPATSPRGPVRFTPDAADDRRDVAPAAPSRRSIDVRTAATRAAKVRAESPRTAATREAVGEAEPHAEAPRAEAVDFAELFALLADTAARELRTRRALEVAGADPSAPVSEPDAELVAAEGADPEGETTPPWNADTLREQLRATVRGLEGQRAAAAIDPVLVAALDRAQRTSPGELRARGDDAAATVRAALDALLDTAGTPRGVALTETVRPAFAAAVTASANDVTTPVRDLDALAPAFRTRLERVMDRMRDEFGHDVQLVETVRSPDRQEHLFAQGRTRPGPVVTWTRDSAHLTGEAADVIVDGRWNHPDGYQRLQEIAAEEGLHTLGMRDPGHLELRGSATEADRARAAALLAVHETKAPATRAAAALGNPAYGVAQVASVARVAAVAQVARVASVARPGSGAVLEGTTPNAAPTESGSSLPNGLPSAAARVAALAGTSDGRSAGGRGGESPRDSRGDRDRASSTDGLAGLSSLSPSAARILSQDAPRVVAPVGPEVATRAEQIAVWREDAPAPSVSALTLQLDGPDGPEQLRVQLRGGVVDAQVSTSSSMLADRLRLQTADLQDALGRHGLESDGVRVQSPTRTQDADAVRLAAVERGEVLKAAGATAGAQSQFEQGSRDRAPSRQPERESREPQQEQSPHQRRRESRQEQR